MSVFVNNDWRSEFGIASDGQKVFFASKADLTAHGADAAQSHVLRRAFDLLDLDGVLCTENIPLVYFKLMKQIESAEAARLHRRFIWRLKWLINQSIMLRRKTPPRVIHRLGSL